MNKAIPITANYDKGNKCIKVLTDIGTETYEQYIIVAMVTIEVIGIALEA